MLQNGLAHRHTNGVSPNFFRHIAHRFATTAAGRGLSSSSGVADIEAEAAASGESSDGIMSVFAGRSVGVAAVMALEPADTGADADVGSAVADAPPLISEPGWGDAVLDAAAEADEDEAVAVASGCESAGGVGAVAEAHGGAARARCVSRKHAEHKSSVWGVPKNGQPFAHGEGIMIFDLKDNAALAVASARLCKMGKEADRWTVEGTRRGGEGSNGEGKG